MTKVYTIQPWSVWIQIKTHGCFESNLTKSALLYDENGKMDNPNALIAYQWLFDQFEKKKHQKITAPVWVWQKYAKADGKLWHDRKYYPNQAVIYLDVPDDQLLLSDFDNWHFPLNGWYLAKDEQDDDDFYSCCDMMTEKDYISAVKDSWQRIFDISNSDYVQGIIPKIKYENVIKVIHQNNNHRDKVIFPKKKVF